MMRYLIILTTIMWSVAALASYFIGSFNVYLVLLVIANLGWFSSENELHRLRERTG